MQMMEQKRETQMTERTGSWTNSDNRAERRGNPGELQEKAMILHAKGLSAWEIRDVLLSCDRVVVSEEMVEAMLEWVMPGLVAWQSRQLAPLYERVCLIELDVMTKRGKKQRNKRGIALLGIVPEGYGEVLGLWLTEAANETFWKTMLSGLKLRGIQRISTIAGIESKGLVLAVDSVFPETEIQHVALYAQESRTRSTKRKDQQRMYQSVWMIGDKQNPTGNVAHGLYMSLCKATRADTPFPCDEAALKALFWRAMEWKASVTSFTGAIDNARCNPFVL